MRTIKIRAWFDYSKIMIHDIELGEDNFKGISPIDNEVYDCWLEYADSIMQFTGLKDKNSKEIYEGDIVNCGTGTGIIIWDSTSCAFKIEWIKSVLDEDKSWIPFKGFKYKEIIGNIYENPELLK